MQEDLTILDYSIVTCTYNPDERILKRCLQAVANLNRQGLRTELILADNNSTVMLESLSYVRAFFSSVENMKIIHVPEPGVKYARMAAIRIARGKHILYIDTDNEPEPDYLQKLKMLNTLYPQVAAWGPAHVTVDFIDGVDPAIESYARIAFQEKHFQETVFGRETEWQFYYPVGTGLCTEANVLKAYVAEAEAGRYSLPGRKGDLLTSGEDTQMILLAIRNGFDVGSSPLLKLKHIIPASRAHVMYLRRLAFGTSSCYDTCLLEVFPDQESIIRQKLIAPAVFTRRVMRKWIASGFGSRTIKTFELIHYTGLRAGTYYALGKSLPPMIQRMISFLKLA